MYKLFLITGALSSAMSVAIGAFGAHALKNTLILHNRLDVFETGVRYQFYHSLAILFLGLYLFKSQEDKYISYAGYCFAGGILLFSGSLYILSITNVGKWGAVTPVGGVLFIAGWMCCVYSFMKL